LTSGCTYESPVTSCLKLKGDLRFYKGQKLEGCYAYIALYKWREEDYFLGDGTCIDMISIPYRCDGTLLCSSFSDPILQTFFQEAVYVEIVAFSK